MVRRIERFSVHRTSLTGAMVYGVIGLIAVPALLTSEPPPRWFAFFVPVGFAGAGYVMIACYCLLYNVIAPWTGGIEFTVVDR